MSETMPTVVCHQLFGNVPVAGKSVREVVEELMVFHERQQPYEIRDEHGNSLLTIMPWALEFVTGVGVGIQGERVEAPRVAAPQRRFPARLRSV